MIRFAPCTLVVLGFGWAIPAAPPSSPVPGQIWVDPESGMAFCYCPPGTFWMGTPEEGLYQVTDQKPRHPVTLTRGFWLGRWEVTTAQWQAVMGTVPLGVAPGAEPVTGVSWDDCQAFLRRLNGQAGAEWYRLPTEAEWEYACGAGTAPRNYLGFGSAGLGAPYGGPGTAGLPNAWGLDGMLGYIREWCSDWGGPYPAGAATDPQGPRSGQRKVNRGGHGTFQNRHSHPTWRWYYTPDFRDNDLGFRIVRVEE